MGLRDVRKTAKILALMLALTLCLANFSLFMSAAKADLGGTISGTVTDYHTSDPIASVSVKLYNANGDWVSVVYTDANGYYRFEDVAPGSYRVRFDPAYHSSEWYHNASTFDTATWVIVEPGTTATADEDLVYQFGAVSGTVRDAVTGLPIAGILVDVYELNEGLLAFNLTDGNGHFEFPSLAIGSYKLYFEGDSNHQGEWHHNAASFSSATAVGVTSWGTTTINEDLLPLWNITATSDPADGGMASGSGKYAHGTMVYLEAVPYEGYSFVNWTEDGVGEVSTDADYSFAAGADRALVANFALSVPAPTISTVSPTVGKIGTLVTITGTNFGAARGTSYVSFGSKQAAEYTAWSNTQIVCKVPAGTAGQVNLSLTTGGGTSNLKTFKITPYLSGITPASGAAGTVVTINGTGFGATRGTSYVSFGAVKVTTYVSWTPTQIKVKVPAGAAGAVNLSVTTAGGKSNLKAFKVKPKITKLSPLSGTPGTVVTITGSCFGATRGTSYVTFGTTKVTSYVSWSNTVVKVKVPTTAVGAKLVKVTTPGGTSAGVSFTVK